MFDTRIEIYDESTSRDSYNETTGKPDLVGVYYAQRTENGGRENLYASRIVHENEVVFTIRYASNISPGMTLQCGDEVMRIKSIQPEGRRYRLHIKCTYNDANDQS